MSDFFDEWRDIPGYEGVYQANRNGSIRSVDRNLPDKNGRLVKRRGVTLKPAASPSGHLTVVLGRNNTKQVHQLVLLTFIGRKKPGMEILHLNHTPGDNRLFNLRYGTRSENLKMDYAAGKRSTPIAWIHSDNGTRKNPYVK